MVVLIIKIILLIALAQGVVNGLNYINSETLSYVVVMFALMMLIETILASAIGSILDRKENNE